VEVAPAGKVVVEIWSVVASITMLRFAVAVAAGEPESVTFAVR
jgi:hypothetical protein